MEALPAVHRACFDESMPYVSTIDDHITFNSPRISTQERHGSDVLPKIVEAGSDRLEHKESLRRANVGYLGDLLKQRLLMPHTLLPVSDPWVHRG